MECLPEQRFGGTNINEILFALLLTESINQKGKREDFKTSQGLFKKIITVESKLLGKVVVKNIQLNSSWITNAIFLFDSNCMTGLYGPRTVLVEMLSCIARENQIYLAANST